MIVEIFIAYLLRIYIKGIIPEVLINYNKVVSPKKNNLFFLYANTFEVYG